MRNLNPDFKRGLYTGMGVLVAIYVVGLATGVLKKVF
jgi:predicted branched-subunit amino acid permease